MKPVNVDRVAMRYCPNMEEHWHFRCDTCGGVFDIDLPAAKVRPEMTFPKGFQATTYEISVRGACPHCATTNQN